MKTLSLSRTFINLTIIIAVLLMVTNVDARQICRRSTLAKYFKPVEDTGSNYTSSFAGKSIRLNNISMKVRRDFMLRFTNANNAMWYKVDGGFVVNFSSGTASSSVTYAEDGGWLYTISRYDEKSMPPSVRALVKSTYFDYDVVNVAAIEAPGNNNIIHLVYIQDATTIKELRICNGEMEVLHDYIRGK